MTGSLRDFQPGLREQSDMQSICKDNRKDLAPTVTYLTGEGDDRHKKSKTGPMQCWIPAWYLRDQSSSLRLLIRVFRVLSMLGEKARGKPSAKTCILRLEAVLATKARCWPLALP